LIIRLISPDEATTTSLSEGSAMSIKQKIRKRRAVRQFERALDSASPAMRHELIALAARQNWHR
jgi:hypothetical protein